MYNSGMKSEMKAERGIERVDQSRQADNGFSKGLPSYAEAQLRQSHASSMGRGHKPAHMNYGAKNHMYPGAKGDE